MTDAINADQLRITVEMGDDFEPSPELAAALDQLRTVLIEGDTEVQGFASSMQRSFMYDSMTPGAHVSGTPFDVEVDNVSKDLQVRGIFKF